VKSASETHRPPPQRYVTVGRLGYLVRVADDIGSVEISEQHGQVAVCCALWALYQNCVQNDGIDGVRACVCGEILTLSIPSPWYRI